jgi:predicted nucleic acid-binding protein
MADRAVVNASPLVVLSRAGRLELLRLVGDRIVIPQAVVEEVKGHSDEAARALEDGSWF